MTMRSYHFSLLQSILLFCVSLAAARMPTAHIIGNITDRLALLAFKDQITQDPQGFMSSWNDSLRVCDWEGVTCNLRHQRVMALDLDSHGLVGSISPYIGNLSFLKYLHLQNNSLHGQIPQEIGRLFRLRDLLLHNNSLSGPIPLNLSHCSSLVTLGLSYNKLTGKIPQEFGSFSKLVGFGLRDNNLTGTMPSILGNISSLQIISFFENSLTGTIPESFGQLKRLTYLGLGENMFSGMFPPALCNISSLVSLALPLNRFEGSLPRNIGLQLPNLRTFTIGGNHFSGFIPISLFTNASFLQILDFSMNKFSGEVPRDVGNLKGLTYLSLGKNDFGSGGEVDDLKFITSLTNCSNLRLLSIVENRFGGRLPGSLTNLSIRLDSLYLGTNYIFGSIPSSIGKLLNLILFSAEFNLLTGTIPHGIGMLQKLQVLLLDGNRLLGQIPYSIGNLSSSYYLALNDNYLEGSIVTSFVQCQYLQFLYLSHNNLTGVVPKVLGLSTQLLSIDLSHNNLVGALPSEVGNLKNLFELYLSENNISGKIPSTLGSCVNLKSLYLDGNFFQGGIPPSFGGLNGIEEIDLSQNNLFEKISKDLENLPYLRYLNLSFNKFEGEVPTKGVFQNVSAFSVVGNDKLCGGISELNLPDCHMQKHKKHGMRLALKVALGVVLPPLIITSLLLALYSRKKHSAEPFSKMFRNSLQWVTYNELRGATNGFSSENLIGMGSYGSVYKGVLHKDGSLIAVKVLNLMARGVFKSFMAECEVLRKTRHRNLVKILTVCSSVDFLGNDFKALIFEFMSNGSLEDLLHNGLDRSRSQSRNLNLRRRLNIAIDVASALDYLHNYCQNPIVHCDLKPSNVLLDDDMVAYVGDFGLAKLLCKNHSNSEKSETSSIALRGTIGYIPPEYGMGAEVSTQGDVYSYGIMLLEMFTGKRPIDAMFNDTLSLHKFCKVNMVERVMDIIDMHLLLVDISNDIEEQRGVTDQMKACLFSIIQIGVACSSEPIVERMEIKDVLTKIQKIKEDFLGNKNNEEI